MCVSQVSVTTSPAVSGSVYVWLCAVIWADLYVISTGSVADYCMPGSPLNFVCAAKPIEAPRV